MRKPVKVEFHKSALIDRYYWHVTVNPPIVGGRGFNSIAQAVKSFRQLADAIDARAPFEIAGNAKDEAHKLLTR